MYRLGNRSLGNNVLAKLGFGPCWTNGRKHKNELGAFIYNAFIYNQARKRMWHSEWGFILCTAGDSKEFVGAEKGNNLQKRTQSRIIATIFHNLT